MTVMEDATQSAHSNSPGSGTGRWLGRAVERLEDAPLLMGAGRYADDLPVAPNTLYAAVVRSSEPHAIISRIESAKARALPGVHLILTGDEVKAVSDPFLIALKAPIDQWSLAVERVRYVGEPVALVLAEDRYIAEDAADLVEVHYEKLPVVVDPLRAVAPDAPLLHPAAKTNEISIRDFTYGDPETAFANADRRVAIKVAYPRASYMPMECFVVVAEYRPAEGIYDVLANFQGPFSTHPVMARSLRVPGNKLRLRIPADSGGSFGIKLSIFPYIVLMAIASRMAGRPVKWVEDRLEHLESASSGPNRITEIEAAVTNEGKIEALRMDCLEDYGAYLRAPMPGPLYRMQGAVTGAYDIRNVALRNRVVVTNKMPAALIRGFGGPQLYQALERLVHTIAIELGRDPLDVIRLNLVPTEKMPYRAAAGALYDSGDYAKAIDIATGDGRLDDLIRRREQARQSGKLYGIGYACVVEPAMSNMGYLSTLIPADIRERAGPKNGAVSMVTVNIDPVGSVGVTADVTVQGQGHRTALAQIVAEQLGLRPSDISVNLELDTQKDQWSIAAGSYSCRFTPGTAVAAHLAAQRIRDKIAKIAAKQLNVLPEDIELADGKVRSKSNPDNAMPFARVVGTAHWSPILLPEGMDPGLRETAVWCPPELEPPTAKDEINTSLTYGFVFDMCGIEIDPVTFDVRVDRYISMHDAGRLINPLLAEGQIRGAFAQGLASALYEEFIYDDAGAFQSGTFASYLVPTACEVPDLEILHMESPSPLTPLGAKGLAEGNCMSTPACISNAVADALAIRDVPLPITPDRLNAIVSGAEPAPPPDLASSAPPPVGDTAGGPALRGKGWVDVPSSPEKVWQALIDPESLKKVIPGCHSVSLIGPHHYRAEVSLGVGPIKGRFTALVKLSDLDEPRFAVLSGGLSGPLGNAEGRGNVTLTPKGEGTHIDYTYSVLVAGKVASVGSRMLEGAAGIVIGQFFTRLAATVEGRSTDGGGSVLERVMNQIKSFIASLKKTFGGKQ